MAKSTAAPKAATQKLELDKAALDRARKNLDEGAVTPSYGPWRDEIVSGVTPIIGGYVEPSMAPGIGVEINFEAAQKYPFVEVQPIQWYQHDGSGADW